MRINTNTAAMNTYSNLTSANASKSSSLAKLSSGLRINKAGDDAAGLAISEKMKNQISGMTQASRNAQDGISLIQTAEGALGETHSILNRMRDLTVQAANGTNTGDDKKAIQSELTSLTKEIDRISGDTEFNTQGLLNGSKITTDSLAGKENGLKSAYNTLHSNETVESPTELATALSKLSEKDLDSVITKYNATTTTTTVGATPEGSYTSDSLKVENAFTEASFNSDLGKGVLEKYNSKETPTDAAGLALLLTDPLTSAETLEKVETAVTEYNQSLKNAGTTTTTTPIAIKAADIKIADKTTFSFQIGANAKEKIGVEIKNMSAKGLGISDIKVDGEDANTDTILDTLDTAISLVSEQRADLGAVQNRLDHTVSNLATTKENLSEANSRITDVDMAEEMMSFTKSNILSQASTSMLAQANQMPQSVLSLLQ